MKAIKYFTCIVLVALTSRIYSQIPDTIWTKTFGGHLADVGNSVKQTNDGGFIVAGTTSSFGAGGQDIYLIKTDENGDTLWTKTFGGTGNDRAANVVQTNDNGYAVFGTTNSFGNVDDLLFLKVDSVGSSKWYRTFNGGYIEYATDGLQTKDNGYIILGNGNYPSQHAWLIKTDTSGNEIWSKFIKGYGVNLPFKGYSVIQTADSGYAVCGYAHTYTPWSDDYQGILHKFSSTGDSLLYKLYDFTSQEVFKVVRETYDGNLILGGATRYFELQRLLKVTQGGDLIWTKEISGSQSAAYLNSLEQDVDRGFIFSILPNGNPPINPDFELIKCDINGNFLWNKRIGGSQYDFARSVYVTNDSGYIVTGETKSFGAGDNDVWLMKFKYPPILNVQINFFPPVDTALVNGGCCTPLIIAKNLISTPVRDSISIEPGPNTIFYYIDSTGSQVTINNYYFIVIDSLNEFEYELRYHPKSFSNFSPIIIPFDSSFYTHENNYDIQLIVNKSGTAIDSFSQPFHADYGLSVDEGSIPTEFSLSQNYPNPFNPVTSIQFAVTNRQFVTLKVYDVLGNEIATLVNEEKQPGVYEVEFSIHSDEGRNLTSGVYFYQLKIRGPEINSLNGQAGQGFIETKKMVLIK